MRHGAYHGQVAAFYGGQDQPSHALSPGTRHHSGSIGVELGGIQVAVGVDPHAWMMNQACK
jgi:hypothetical protein